MKNSLGNTDTYVYDFTNSKTTITDSQNKSTQQSYDATKFITTTVDKEGKTTETKYYLTNGENKYGDVEYIIDRNGNKTSYLIDDRGNITRITNPDLSYKQMEYDVKNNVTLFIDENGKRTQNIYDTNGNLKKTVQPLNGTDAFMDGTSNESLFAIARYEYFTDTEAQALGYKGKALLKNSTDPNGNITTYEYYTDGSLKSATDPEGNKTSYEYDANGYLSATVTPKLIRTEITNDKNGKVEKTILVSGTGETTRIVYDTLGRKIKEISPKLYNSSDDNIAAHTYNGDYGTRYQYYSNGKLQYVKTPDNQITSYTYDIFGNVLTETKPNGSIIQYEYDCMGRVTKIYTKDNSASALVLAEEFSYSILADKTTQKVHKVYETVSKSITTIYIYDFAGRLKQQTNSDGTTIKNTYNLNGTLQKTTDPSNRDTLYAYDYAGRLTQQDTPFQSNAGTTVYSIKKIEYDKNGNVVKEQITSNNIGAATEYDVKEYAYSPRNLLVKVTSYTKDGSNTKLYTQYYYDADGRKVRMYTGLSQPLTISGLDNVTANGDTDYAVTKYQYNSMNKLTVVTDPMNMSINYTSYDKNGNLLTQTDKNGSTIAMQIK